MNPSPMPAGPAMLIVGHPGHELRVHGWLEHAKPIVMVLTDGSGHRGLSRLSSTSALLERSGATPGEVFGRLTDAEVYRAILDGDTRLFTDLAAELAAAIVRERIQVVAGDDAEGFNPAHDVCRLLVDHAIRLARPAAGRSIANLAFTLMETPAVTARDAEAMSSTIVLNDKALARKLKAALEYPEMVREVAAARARWGDEAFRLESFRHVQHNEVWTPEIESPFYERYGAERVSDGAYAEVIRYDAHIRPIIEALAARSLRQAS